jgi:hypothetical protein
MLMAASLIPHSSVYAADTAVVADNAHQVPMVSGGIGEDEENRLSALQKQYNLKLLFTATNGEYLADVSVHVQDTKGNTIVDTVSGGPILLITLPPGSYKVKASEGGQIKEQHVSVAATGKNLKAYQFRFNAPDQDVNTNG